MKLIKRCLLPLTWLFFCVPGAGAEEAMPDFYQEPGIYPNRDYLNQNFNEQIDPFTGGLGLHYADLYLPGNGGFDRNVIRSYKSASVNMARTDPGQASVGWNIHSGA